MVIINFDVRATVFEIYLAFYIIQDGGSSGTFPFRYYTSNIPLYILKKNWKLTFFTGPNPFFFLLKNCLKRRKVLIFTVSKMKLLLWVIFAVKNSELKVFKRFSHLAIQESHSNFMGV